MVIAPKPLRFWLPIVIRPSQTFFSYKIFAKRNGICSTPAGSQQNWGRKLQKIEFSWYSFIFWFSRKFGRVHTLSPSFMEVLLGSLEHFKEWAERHTKKEWFLKSTSLFKDDRVYLKCNSCPYETPTSFNGKYWSVGHLPEHLKESIQCNAIGGLENTLNTIPTDSIVNSQASFTFNFITNVS